MLELLGGVAFGAMLTVPATMAGAYVARNSPNPRAQRAGEAVDRTIRHPVTAVRSLPQQARARSAAAQVRVAAPRPPVLNRMTGYSRPGSAQRRPPMSGPPQTPAAAPVAPTQARPTGSRPRPHLMPVTDDRKETQVTTPNGSNGTPPVAADGQDMFSIIAGMAARGRSGGLPGKQIVIGAWGDGFEYQAQAIAAFAAQMSDDDYAAAMWEPMQEVAAHLMAASSKCSESLSAMRAMTQMTVGEAAASSVRVPKNTELNVS